ncbi:hypothetical protein ABW21_db0205600 [Orbilia brochopaga]|nr:hypothetical protein ABW21_db0205600 [Drechslerella brochopaga]
MKTSFIALAASLSATVYAQGRGGTADTPEDNAINCAKYCLNTYNLQVNTQCDPNDLTCVCSNTEFLGTLDPCFIQSCNASQFSTINAYFKTECGRNNVDLTIDVAPTVKIDLSSVPALASIQCAGDCIGNIFAYTGCAVTDIGCFCGSNGFYDGFGPSVWNSCALDDFKAISDGTQAFCRAVGKTVTVTVAEAKSSIPISTVTNTPAAKTTGGAAGATPAKTSAGATPAAKTGGGSPTTGGNSSVTGSNASPTTSTGDAPRMAVAISGIFAAALAFAVALL